MIKHILFLWGLILFLCSCQNAKQAGPKDWPVFGKDSLRSNSTLFAPKKVNTLKTKWIYKSPQLPKPAWYGPAIWDGYAKSDVLPSMRNYDLVFQPIVVGDKLYFGSTGDDAIHCLDILTGKEEWNFPTEGPIRIAPTFYKGRLYFGSDDGFAYCINARNGKMIWKFAPHNDHQKFLCDGKLISYYPIRTGVAIKDGMAYFAASLLPWKNSYLCAVDAEKGRPVGTKSFIKTFQESTFEGAMVATEDYLIQPQGRVSPTLFDRLSGDENKRIGGASGAFVLVSPNQSVATISGSRNLKMTETSIQSGEEKSKVVSFDGGKALVVSGDTAFLVTEKVIAAHNRIDKSLLWSRKNFFSIAMIKAGKYLFAGGVDKVEAFDSENGELVWSAPVEGKAHGLIFAQDHLFVSTDEGKIYCFDEGEIELKPEEDTREYSNDITRSSVISYQKKTAKSDENRMAGKFLLEIGPRVQFISQDKALVQWETAEPGISTLVFNRNGETQRFGVMEGVTQHKVILSDLRKDRFYSYHIETVDKDTIRRTEEYDLDNFFNYSVPQIDSLAEININRATAKRVNALIERGAPQSGMCLVWGIEKEEFILELARQSKLKVIAVDKDLRKINKIREKLLELGVYGERISLYHISGDEIPFPSGIFNLVVSESHQEEITPEKITRLLRPKGGIALLEDRKAIIARWTSGLYDNLQKANHVVFRLSPQGLLSITKQEVEGAGVWTHLYGKEDNSAFGGEQFWGVEDASDFEVAWMGRPGPRYHAERSGRKVGPLSVDGKLLLQGLNRIIAMDAYNGKILWSCELPGFMRFNMPRDCSNWCADQQFIYVALNDKCLKIDHTTGKMVDYLRVEHPKGNRWKYDWEYIASHEEMIFGTSTRQGASYDIYSSGWGWYDGKSGDQTYQVCSDNLFAFDKSGDNPAWNYENGIILNVTITIGDEKIWFVENTNPKLKKLDSRRLGQKELWKNLKLVCLDANTGKQIYRKPLSVKPGVPVFYLAHSSGKLALVSSYKGYFHVYGFNAEDGSSLWTQKVKWVKDNHGGHMSRPAIVGNRLYVRPGIIDLETGEKLPEDFPFGGCGTYACSQNALFYRSSNVTMWNRHSRSHTKWTRLRPDCWLSTIPAQGMLLSPEGGGGCSCGNWLETSLGFAPITRGSLAFSAPSSESGRFNDSLSVAVVQKQGIEGTIRYTTDGSKPSKKSEIYNGTINIDDHTTLTVGIFDQNGILLSTVRKQYLRNYPAPNPVVDTTIVAGKVSIRLKKKLSSGTTLYTTDGSSPGPNSLVYNEPFVMDESGVVKAVTLWKTKNGEYRFSSVKQIRVDVEEALKPSAKK